jgi:putative redox protein
MKDSIKINWKQGMAFEAEIDEFKIMMDAKKEHGGGGAGPRPKPLMMVSLAGCTGMDVVSILNKMRVELEDFSVVVEGDLTDEHPKQFTRMHIIYKFKGKNLEPDKLKKAIDLSQDRYCGVSATYRKTIEITYEIKIL